MSDSISDSGSGTSSASDAISDTDTSSDTSSVSDAASDAGSDAGSDTGSGAFKKSVLVAIAAVIGFLCVLYFSSRLTLDQKLVSAADRINATCPKMISNNLRMDYVESGPGKIFYYYYTFVYSSVDDINATTIEKKLKPALIYDLKNKDVDTLQAKNNVEMIYVFRSKDQQEITRISILPSDYL